jgi:hypothetical protein
VFIGLQADLMPENGLKTALDSVFGPCWLARQFGERRLLLNASSIKP